MKDFIVLEDCSVAELTELLTLSSELKARDARGEADTSLRGRTMAMIFEKPSSRTRMSFQVAMGKLGGDTIYNRPEDIGGLLGKREPIKDIARVMNGYVDVIVARTFSHDAVCELAEYADVPVINALTDKAHPCQAMADMLTIQEQSGDLAGKTLTYIGDGNNVANSLAVACVRLGMTFHIAAPKGYELSADLIDRLSKPGAGTGSIRCFTNPSDAAKGADVLYTDTWVSMGQEDEKEKRIRDFSGYQINSELMRHANPGAKVMHCLPAYRGLEITDEMIESPQSIIFQEAENRLHFQRALLKYLVAGKAGK